MFAKQSGRKKVILPIRHKLTIEELRKRNPIQASVVSPSSDEGISKLCDEVVSVVRPELMAVENIHRAALDANANFIRAAEAELPEYTFSVLSNVEPISLAPDSQPVSKVEIRMKDPGTVKQPPTIKLSFKGGGVRKAAELLKTGKPQTWNADEFSVNGSDVPLFPKVTDGAICSIGPNTAADTRPVRVEIGDPAVTIFQLMDLNVVRKGSDEGVISISSPREAFSLIVLTRFNASHFDLSCSWDFGGHTGTQCERAVHAVDAILEGTPIRVVDLRGERKTFTLPLQKIRRRRPVLQEGFRKLFALCSAVEERFNVHMTMPANITDKDCETLTVLDCLVNGSDYPYKISGSVNIVKTSGEERQKQLNLLAGAELYMFRAVTNYQGYFDLFGARINTPEWGVRSTCLIEADEKAKQDFMDASEGTIYNFKFRATSSKLDWVAHFPPVGQSPQ